MTDDSTGSIGPAEPTDEPVDWESWDVPTERWLRAEHGAPGWPRSLLLEIAVRIAFPTVLVLSVYLLFAGHYDVGGGFPGGLVAGFAFVMRYVAGGSVELAAAVRIKPPALIGAGLGIAVLTALVPLGFGLPALTSVQWHPHVPVLGELSIASSLLLDVGVYLLIVGLVLDLLRTLGAGIETRDLEGEAR
ncbi:multisubunit sodium/proton antiporter MrpB subunit [Prauserella shujinwangii]|uniref:Multisubunit sodium/proton antiporter MrpB subunit n=1 Tax=Prauserella shujinwangii TaxID=1453103 RepID=A0A2T0LRR9_9PSEU|nr:MnhB domain-containing protein [Prauserella shujinwangii]PRX46200.1 multisubunit sodium/proton antiporter MrpB subunit [Prauserella shujinwangii]